MSITLTEMARSGYFLCLDKCGKPTELKDVDATFQSCAVCGGRVRWMPPAFTSAASEARPKRREPKRFFKTLP